MKKMYLSFILVLLVKLNFATLVVTITAPSTSVDTICQNSDVMIGCNVSGATSTVSYVWTLNNTQVATVQNFNYILNNPGNYICIVTATSGAETSSDTVVFVVSTTTMPAITLIVDSVCSGTPFTLTPMNLVNGVVPPGTTYSWTNANYAGGLTGGAAGSGDSIYGTIINPTNTPQTAVYTVTPSSGTGCVGTAFTVNVVVNPMPAIPSVTASDCSGYAFTITPTGVPAGTTYSWPYPTSAGGITGLASGNNATCIAGVLTNVTNTPCTAVYTVTPTSVVGCVGNIFYVTVTVSLLPAVTGAITGNTNVIAGQQNVVYSANQSADAYANTFLWTLPSGATGTSLTDSIVVNFSSAATSGYITVKAINACGDGTASSLYINVDTVVPNCSAQFALVADTTTPHHYYAVNNATGVPPLKYIWSWGDGTHDTIAYPSHTYDSAGYYKICLTITDSTGCTNTYCDSSYLQKSPNSIISVNVIPQGTLGINTDVLSHQIKIYPNPAKEILTIETNSNTEQRIEIINLIGQTVYTNIINKKATINTSAFANGVYIIKLYTDKETVVKKFIKE